MTQMQVNMQANEEKRRSDMANEAIKEFDAQTNLLNAKTNQRNADSKEKEVAIKDKVSTSEILKNAGSGVGTALKGAGSLFKTLISGGIL